MAYGRVLKFNPNHDKRGRFASAPGGSSTGGPPVVYHGTNAEFSTFRESEESASGFWFSEGKEVAGKYARLKGGKVKAYQIAATKTLHLDMDMNDEMPLAKFYDRVGMKPADNLRLTAKLPVWEMATSRHFKAALLETGHDSIRVREDGHWTWGVFDAAKIKEVITKFNPNHDPANGRFTSGPGGQHAAAFRLSQIMQGIRMSGVLGAKPDTYPSPFRPAKGELAASLRKGKVNISGREMDAAMRELAAEDEHANLSNLHVDGKPVFSRGHRGFKREDMPQVRQSLRQQFIDELPVRVTRRSVDPLTLKPTQGEINGPKTAQLYQKFRNGTAYPDQPLLVSRGGHVLDGHHNWASKLAMRVADGQGLVEIFDVNMSQDELLSAMRTFADRTGTPNKSIHKEAPAMAKFASVLKFNPNHDPANGRFAAGSAGAPALLHHADTVRVLTALQVAANRMRAGGKRPNAGSYHMHRAFAIARSRGMDMVHERTFMTDMLAGRLSPESERFVDHVRDHVLAMHRQLHPTTKAEVLAEVEARVAKYNPNHDAKGRFAKGPGVTGDIARDFARLTPRQHAAVAALFGLKKPKGKG